MHPVRERHSGTDRRGGTNEQLNQDLRFSYRISFRIFSMFTVVWSNLGWCSRSS
jgi:hypothetical protein